MAVNLSHCNIYIYTAADHTPTRLSSFSKPCNLFNQAGYSLFIVTLELRVLFFAYVHVITVGGFDVQLASQLSARMQTKTKQMVNRNIALSFLAQLKTHLHTDLEVLQDFDYTLKYLYLRASPPSPQTVFWVWWAMMARTQTLVA